ncbi:transposase [Methylobacterium aquaticum]|uniref:transposase n=1 Tax=Methylobacterium aquaticum TaxID=270351 RepID=UPI0009E65988
MDETARFLERADPPRSPSATPARKIVAAIAWHVRVGGAWRALPESVVPCRTVYGWFRRWIEKRLFEILMRALARRQLRRRAAGAGCRQGAVAEAAPGDPGWRLHGRMLPGVVPLARHGPSRRRDAARPEELRRA